MQSAHTVAETVDEPAGRLLEIAHLHQRSGKIQARDIDRFPRRGLRWKAVLVDQLWPAILREDRGIEAETGADDHAIVAVIFLNLICSHEADRDEIRGVAAIRIDEFPIER